MVGSGCVDVLFRISEVIKQQERSLESSQLIFSSKLIVTLNLRWCEFNCRAFVIFVVWPIYLFIFILVTLLGSNSRSLDHPNWSWSLKLMKILPSQVQTANCPYKLWCEERSIAIVYERRWEDDQIDNSGKLRPPKNGSLLFLCFDRVSRSSRSLGIFFSKPMSN